MTKLTIKQRLKRTYYHFKFGTHWYKIKRIFIKPEHYRTGCTSEYPDNPSLYDRLEYTINLIDKTQIIYHTSYPIELLKKHISIGCLDCQCCHEKKYHKYEGLPVLAYTDDYLLVVNDTEDWGSQIHVFKTKSYMSDETTYIPMIQEKGATFLLPNNHPVHNRKDIEFRL